VIGVATAAWAPELAEAVGSEIQRRGLWCLQTRASSSSRRELLVLKGNDFWSLLAGGSLCVDRTDHSPDSQITSAAPAGAPLDRPTPEPEAFGVKEWNHKDPTKS